MAESTGSRFIASRRYRWLAGAIFFSTFIIVLLGFHRSPAYNPSSIPEAPVPGHSTTTDTKANSDINWSTFAYTQYVTNSEYLCNSVMFFEALKRLNSKADRVMMYPVGLVHPGDHSSLEARLVAKARDEYDVKLVPIEIQHRDNADGMYSYTDSGDADGRADIYFLETWADSFTKLLAFNQTQYKRVLSIDSDSLLLQQMDELFLIPPTPVAMPRAYWLFPEQTTLSSQVMLIEPSDAEFSRIQEQIRAASKNDYDMEIVNYLYNASALILPHRKYDLISGEFRRDTHGWYLGSDVEIWDPAKVYSEAKLVHFSDWPLPKPWLPIPENKRIEIQPKCYALPNGEEDCTARIIWNGLYTDFKKKREEVCK